MRIERDNSGDPAVKRFIDAMWDDVLIGLATLGPIDGVRVCHQVYESTRFNAFFSHAAGCAGLSLVMALSRLLDDDRDCVSVFRFAAFAEQNRTEFRWVFQDPEAREKWPDPLAAVRTAAKRWTDWQRENPHRAQIKLVRDWTAAHRDRKVALGERVLEDLPLEAATTVLEDAHRMLNEYRGLFDATELNSGNIYDDARNDAEFAGCCVELAGKCLLDERIPTEEFDALRRLTSPSGALRRPNI